MVASWPGVKVVLGGAAVKIRRRGDGYAVLAYRHLQDTRRRTDTMKHLIPVALLLHRRLVALALSALSGPAERAGRMDKRLTAAEQRGAWEQGSPRTAWRTASTVARIVFDRREDRRDRAVDHGPA
jgi:hypothetical protein